MTHSTTWEAPKNERPAPAIPGEPLMQSDARAQTVSNRRRGRGSEGFHR